MPSRCIACASGARFLFARFSGAQGPLEIAGQAYAATGFHTGQGFSFDACHLDIEEMGRDITNTPMLGAFPRATGIFDMAVAGQEDPQSRTPSVGEGGDEAEE